MSSSLSAAGCLHATTMQIGAVIVCENCGKTLSGSTSMLAPDGAIDPKPADFRILNIHGHGTRRTGGPTNCMIPSGWEVAFWVPDEARLAAAARSFDKYDGTPAEKAREKSTDQTWNYTTFALDPKKDDCNLPAKGNQVRGNLIEAIQAAAAHGAASWIVSTGCLNSLPNTGVISLSYIIATIGQTRLANAHKWRINWICCREVVA